MRGQDKDITTRLDIKVREASLSDAPACASLLASLPEWFGFPDVNAGYIASLEKSPAFVADVAGDVSGFIILERHGDRPAEIVAMAVKRDLHRRGVGHALVDRARTWCRDSGVKWLHVKTRGPSTPDPNYARTIQFYLGEGFDPLYESLTEWGPENAALVLVQSVT